MHTLDRYFTHTKGNQMTDEIAEALLRTVIENGRKAWKDQTDYEAMSELMWCSSLSHNGITGFGAEKILHPIRSDMSSAQNTMWHTEPACLLSGSPGHCMCIWRSRGGLRSMEERCGVCRRKMMWLLREKG